MPVTQPLPDGPFAVGSGTPGPDVTDIVAFLGQKGTATDAEILAAVAGRLGVWAASTAYAAGQSVVNPSGELVKALAAFTSGTTYSAANWSTPASATYPLRADTVAAAAGAAVIGKIEAATDAVTIAIVGDSTSTDDYGDGWGPALGLYLAAQFPGRPVTRREFNTTSLTYDAAVTVQTGTGSSVDIYSGGAPGQPVQYSTTNFAALVPVAPDCVIINHGFNNGEGVSPTPPSAPGFRVIYRTLVRKITSAYPRCTVILTVQPPKTAPQTGTQIAVHARIGQAIREVAATEGLGLIDVEAAFLRSGQTPTALTSSDGIHPTLTVGFPIWALEAQRMFRRKVAGQALAPRRTLDKIIVSAQEFGVVQGTVPSTYSAEDASFVRHGFIYQLPDTARSGLSKWVTIPDHWESFLASVIFYSNDTTGSVTWQLFVKSLSPGAAANTGARPLGGLVDAAATIPNSPIVLPAPGPTLTRGPLSSHYAPPGPDLRDVLLTVGRIGDNASDTAVGVYLHAVILERA